MQQQITRGDYLKDLITIYIENNLQKDITELYSEFIFQCGEIQKTFEPAQVIKISFSEQESLKLKNLNTCYLAGITVEGHKETFNGSLTFNTRGEVVKYEPAASTITPSGTSSTCDCQGLRGVYSNCCQPAIKAYFSLNYVPTKLSELQNDTDFVDSVDVAESISIHNASTEAHPYIQSVITTETEALETAITEEASLRVAATEALQGSINAETTAREEAISLAISTTEAYADNSVSVHNSSTEAHPYIQGLISAESTNRENADNNLQTQIDGLAAASDVTDIVGTYAELQDYDTQHLNNNDIIKVLSDETHDDEPSYYRFNKTAGTFSYIGSESASYTKAQADAKFVTQTTTINGEALSQNITLTATEVGALPSTTTINDLTTTAQQNAINSTATTAKINQIATNTTNIASNTSAIASNTSAIASNTEAISNLQDLSNLSDTGNVRLRALKSYADEGELLTDAEGLAFVKNYAHSTFDLSKFTVTGSPNITDDGIASGFSGYTTYLDTQCNISSYDDWDIYYKLKLTTVTPPASYQIFLCTKQHGLNIGFLYDRLWFGVSTDGTNSYSPQQSTQTFNINTDYWFHFSYKNGVYTAEYSLDGKNYIDTGISITKGHSYSSEIGLGSFIAGSVNQPFLGSIDLKQFSITVDGVEVFSGNKTGIDTIKPDDFKVITDLLAYTYDTHTIYAGNLSTTNNVLNPNLYNADGSYYTGEDWEIVSTTVDDVTTYSIEYNGNSATRNSGSDITLTTVNGTVDAGFKITEDGIAYPRVDGRFNIIDSGISLSDSSTDWEIESEVVLTGDIMNAREYFTGSYPSQGRIVDVELNASGQFKAGFHLASNTIAEAIISNVPTTVGTKIRYIVGRKDTTCYLELYINDNYFNRATKTASSDVQTPSQRISFGNYKVDYPRTCFAAINLNKTYIRKRGNLVYQPCLKIPYTESKTGSKIVNSIYRDRVNDMANQFGFANYYTLQDEDKGNYVVVGSPTISSDFVASGFSTSNYLSIQNIDFSQDFVFVSPVFNTNSIPNIQSDIVYSSATNSIFELCVQSNGTLKTLLKGTSDILRNESLTISLNTNYQIKITKVGTTYSAFYKTDVSDWTLYATSTSSLLLSNSSTLSIGMGGSGGNYPLDGSIDLKEFKIYVDNKLAYEAVTEPNFTLPQVELYGLIGQRTLRRSYNDGINYADLWSDRTLEQGGSCTSGVEVTLPEPFVNTNYVLSVPYSAKSATAFTPTQTGDWMARGKGIL